MADVGEESAESRCLVQKRLVEALEVVINLLDAKHLRQVHEETSKGNNRPQDGVYNDDDPPDGRVRVG